METTRVEWIDTLKGFAIVCVVLGHIADGYLNAGMFPESKQLLHNLFNVTYMFHMALLFTLSGLTFQMAYGSKLRDSGKARIRAQVINLISLYVLYCVLNWVFKMIASGYVNQKVRAWDILLIWGKPVYPYWYFYVLIVFYLLFGSAFIHRITINNSMPLMLLLVTISALSGFINTKGWFEIQHILFYSAFFYLGIMYVEKKVQLLFNPIMTGALSLTSLAIAVIYWDSESFIWVIPVVNTIVAIGIVVGIICLFSRAEVASQKGLLNYLGKSSLEIYVLHCFFTAGNRVIFSKLGIDNVYISVILNLTCSIYGSLLFAFITKKMRIYDLFFKPCRLIEKRKTNV